MPTYVYETVPASAGEAPERFELRQSMHDAPLTQHPDTQLRVRRVLSGGLATFTQGAGSDGAAPARGAMPTMGCGASSCCMTQ